MALRGRAFRVQGVGQAVVAVQVLQARTDALRRIETSMLYMVYIVYMCVCVACCRLVVICYLVLCVLNYVVRVMVVCMHACMHVCMCVCR